MSIFKKKEHKPNVKQQECIDTIKGKVMVLAGPGTGKTFTLINRIKAILEGGVESESVLCLAFSNTAAAEMKERLVSKIGTQAAGVAVHTYHSFCVDLIKTNPAEFQLMENFKLIDSTSRRNVLLEVIDTCTVEHYRSKMGDISWALSDIFQSIAKIKKKKVTKEEFFKSIKTNPEFEEGIRVAQGMLDGTIDKGRKGNDGLLKRIEECKKRTGKAHELWEIYEKYTVAMKEKGFIDYDDMINFVLDAFRENESFLKDVASPYKYLMVDEYQDTNPLQNEVVFNILEAMGEQNIFVVGDDDQIIYEFQGANKNNLENFLSKYPDTKVICLNENNRSTQSVLDCSYDVISQDLHRIENNPEYARYNITKMLIAKNESVTAKDKKVQMNIFADNVQEQNSIVEDIEKLAKEGVALKEIAIICRQNKTLGVYAELLKNKGIPFQQFDGKDIFTINSVIVTYFYLKTLVNPELYYDKLFGLLVSPPFSFEYSDYSLLLEKWQRNHKDFVSNIREMLNEAPWQDKEKVENFLETFDKLREFKACSGVKNTIIEVINLTGILPFFLETKVNRNENITGLKKLIDEAESLVSLNPTSTIGDFVEHLDNALLNGIEIKTDKASHVQDAVQLVTYHGSKGREFEHVYLSNLTKNEWESKRSKADSALPFDPIYDTKTKKVLKTSEQLKLLFVGITRAKHTLNLSFANESAKTPQQLTGYLANLDTAHFEVKTFDFSEGEDIIQIAKTISNVPYWQDQGYLENIREKVQNIKLSPSSLNDFINCPRKYFYSHILELKQKDGNWDSANYGTVFHRVLENAVNTAKESGSYPCIEEMVDELKRLLSKKAISSKKVRLEYEARGEKKLREYYPQFVSTSPKAIVALEYPFDNVETTNGTLNGKIDRVEKFPDGTYGLYDYKTNSSKPANDVEDGRKYEHYLNQLRFYKYSYEKLHDVEVKEVGLIFPEDCEGNVRKQLTDWDNEVIEEKINNAFLKIKALEFDAPKQNAERCKYCGYKQLCKLDVI